MRPGALFVVYCKTGRAFYVIDSFINNSVYNLPLGAQESPMRDYAHVFHQASHEDVADLNIPAQRQRTF